MSRVILTCLMVGAWSFVQAAEKTTTPPSGAHYLVKFTFSWHEDLRKAVVSKKSFVSQVVGTKGTPLKCDIGGLNGPNLALEVQDIAGSKPTQYLVKFRFTEVKNGKTCVVCAPQIVTVVGHPAKLSVGDGSKNGTDVDLIVEEKTAADPAAPIPTSREQSPVHAGPDGGTSLTNMVSLPLIIQDEEDEKMDVQPQP